MHRSRLAILLGLILAASTVTCASADDRGTCFNDKSPADAAVEACSRLISSGKYKTEELAKVHLWRGRAFNAKPDYDRAINDFDQSIQLNLKIAVTYNYRGHAYRLKGEHDRAIADFAESIRLDPKSTVPYELRGQILALKGEHDRAIQDFNEAIRLGSRTATVYGDRASSFIVKRDLDRALPDVDEAIRLDPKSGRLFYLRGEIRRAQNDMERAIADYDEAIRLSPNHAAVYAGRGYAWRAKGDNDRAISDLDQFIRLEPKSVAGYRERAGAWFAKGNNDRAIADFDEAIKLNSKDPNLYRGRGSVRHQMRDLDRAIADYGETIRLSPRDMVAFRGRGVARRETGDLDGAIADFGEAIRLDPGFASAYAGRGLVHEKKGNLDLARADFNIALSLPVKDEVGRRAHQAARERLAALNQGQSASPPGPSAIGGEGVPPAPAPAPATPSALASGPRVALVMGNSDYRHATRLQNPGNDAADVSQVLRKLGFDVVEGRNLDKRGMEDKVREFGRKLDRANLALFFYAGHGMQVGGRNYLVPIDAKLERPGDLTLDAIDVSQVLAQMEAEQRVNLVFLDACRDNPLARTFARSLGARSTSVGQGLATIQSAVGTMIAYATQPDNVALDGEGRNSPFTVALLKHLATPGQDIGVIMRRVRADVIQATRNKQVPWDHSSLIGEVVLAR